MNRTRAFRRHKEIVKKRWAKRTFSHWWNNYTDKEKEHAVGILAETPKRCSNPDCCGNPRKGRYSSIQQTPQEIRAELDFEEQLDELEDEIE